MKTLNRIALWIVAPLIVIALCFVWWRQKKKDPELLEDQVTELAG